MLESAGKGLIWSEKMGEAGNWGIGVLKIFVYIYKYTSPYNMYPDGSLRTLPFLIIVLAIVMNSCESPANQNTQNQFYIQPQCVILS